MMLAEFDLLVRGAVIGTVLLVFFVLLMRPDTRRKSPSVGALALTLAAHMGASATCTGSMAWADCGILVVVARLLPVAVTWFVLDIFLDTAGGRWLRSGFISASLVVSLLWIATPHEQGLCVLSALLLYSGLLVLALWTARGDLVESRRAFRPVFVAAVSVFGVIRTLSDNALAGTPEPGWLSLGYSVTFMVFALIFALWALSPGREIWKAETAPPAPAERGAPTQTDRQAMSRIASAMDNQLWRREGLTIGAMAHEIGIPEHRLRRAINRDLGYRNFSAFVNGYRIEAAKTALAAPENAHRTILEIAYDVGFASLGPFNKAFRALTGTSPRDYRRSLERKPSIPA